MFSPDTEERWNMDVVYGREKGTNCLWVFFSGIWMSMHTMSYMGLYVWIQPTTFWMLNVSKCINVLTTLDRSSWSKLSFDMYKQTLPSAKGFVGKYWCLLLCWMLLSPKFCLLIFLNVAQFSSIIFPSNYFFSHVDTSPGATTTTTTTTTTTSPGGFGEVGTKKNET